MARNVLTKPAAFQKTFVRKPGADKTNTHYCPGCGHGIVHKLIAEALSDMGLQDRAIIVAPVGCTVFLYYYFECAAVSVPHGRAPAALTAISRAHPEAIAISYQGDGDLAAIGMAEIIHAANRGEHMAVFFVNNAIYGMTGGQMAPTSLIDMKTTTSPYGRSARNDGYPFLMSEMIASLRAPVYVERVSLDTAKGVLGARKAIRKALKVQEERKGFAFVEILSPCPTNWHVDPISATEWMREQMLPVFKPGVYKDIVSEVESRPIERRSLSAEDLYRVMGVAEEPRRRKKARPLPQGGVRLKFAGEGGQGVLTLGVLAAQAAVDMGYHVTGLPSYGPEKRGGKVNLSLVVSAEPIGSPLVKETDALLAMNALSLKDFLPSVRPGGMVFYNSSLATRPPEPPPQVALLGVPTQELAERAGDARAANSVLLGAYNAAAGILDGESLERALLYCFAKPGIVEVNQKAIAAGEAYAKAELPSLS